MRKIEEFMRSVSFLLENRDVVCTFSLLSFLFSLASVVYQLLYR